MVTIECSEKELDIIILSLRERENIMFNQSLIYKNQGNKLAQMDCIEEWRIAQHLRERLEKISK
jgi:hypothetical protein